MKNSFRLLAIAACAVAMTGCVAVRPRPLTVDQVEAQTEVIDDVMNTVIVARSPSLSGFHTSHSDIQVEQIRLMAVQDRKAAAPTYRVHLRLVHRMGGWTMMSRATYLNAAGDAVEAKGFRRGSTDVSCHAGCEYTEEQSFEVDRETLVRASQNDDAPAWRLRFYGDRGHLDESIDRSVIPGFIAAVDRMAAKATAQH